MTALIVGAVIIFALILGATIWQVVVAGRFDGPNARSVFGDGTPTDARPLATMKVRASETGPMPFGYHSASLEVHSEALVFRFAGGGRPLVVPRDETSGMEHRRSLGSTSFFVLGPEGQRTSLSFLAPNSKLRRTLSAGGAIDLVGSP